MYNPGDDRSSLQKSWRETERKYEKLDSYTPLVLKKIKLNVPS